MTDRRPLLRAIYDAAVAAAHPDVVLASHLRPVPKGKGDLPRRRQGRGRDGRGRGAALPRRARNGAVAAHRHRHHAPRPWRSDAADQGDRGRTSGARRGGPQGRRRQLEAGRGGDRGRSAAGAAVRRRLRQLDRAGRWHQLRAKAAGDPGAAALRRADRRDQYGAKTSVADQGRPSGARRPGVPRS